MSGCKRVKTKEEYEAQALLLGMEYWEDTHVFAVPLCEEIDADTLEPVSLEEVDRRARAYYGAN